MMLIQTYFPTAEHCGSQFEQDQVMAEKKEREKERNSLLVFPCSFHWSFVVLMIN